MGLRRLPGREGEEARPQQPARPPARGPRAHRLEGFVAQHAHVAAVLVHQQLDLSLLALPAEPRALTAGAAWGFCHLAVHRLCLSSHNDLFDVSAA